MTLTQSLHAIASEIATTLPDAAARLHRLANRVGHMEEAMDERVEDARQWEMRQILEESGVVLLPGRWGRA